MQSDAAQIGEDHPTVRIQADEGYVLTEAVEQSIERHQREHRREHLENQHPFQQRRLTGKAHAGKGVGAGGGEHHDTHRRNASDFYRVP